MTLLNEHKGRESNFSKKTFHRLFWGFSTLVFISVPLVFSSGCYYQKSNQVFYVDAPECISQNLGINSPAEIPAKVSEFNQKNIDEKIDYLFGNESNLVSSYIEKFKAAVDGDRRIDFTLSLAPNFVFVGSQKDTKVFSWTFGILSSDVKVHSLNLPPQEAGEKTPDYCTRLRQEWCRSFNRINSLDQQIALVFGNESAFNSVNTKSVTASIVPPNDEQSFYLTFRVDLNSGFAFASEETSSGQENSLTHTFYWSPSELSPIQADDYNHFLVMKDLQPVNFADWFNQSSLEFKTKCLLNKSSKSYKLDSARAIANDQRCQIFFKLVSAEKTQQNASWKSEELSSWVISEKEYNRLANLISFYDGKEFALDENNPFKNASLQTIDFRQITQTLSLKFPLELTSAFYINHFSFDRELSKNTNKVDLSCQIDLYPYRFISATHSSLVSDHFKIKLRDFASVDTVNALNVIKQYSYSATDATTLSDQLAKALVCPPKETEDYTSITIKGILSQVSESLSQVICRDTHIITQINQLLDTDSGSGGFNLVQLEPFVQKALMGLFQNKSVNDILASLTNQISDHSSSNSAQKEMVRSLMIDPTVINQIFSIFSAKIPVISSMVKAPLLLLTSPSTFGSSVPVQAETTQWWKYGLAAQNALMVFLPRLMSMSALDIINGIVAIYLTEELSQINRNVLDLTKLKDDPKLKQVSEALADINKRLYPTNWSKFPKVPVYITNIDKEQLVSDITDGYVGFDLTKCAYRNLTSPEIFLRNFIDACLKRISGAKRDTKDPNTIHVPASAWCELATFGFIINDVTNKDNVDFTFHPNQSNPYLTMTINGKKDKKTVLSLTNLIDKSSVPSSAIHWANSDQYKDGLFNTSFYGLLGTLEGSKTKNGNDQGKAGVVNEDASPKDCLIKDICKILNYNFAGSSVPPIISDSWYKIIVGYYDKPLFSVKEKYYPGFLDESGLTPKNLYDTLKAIIEPIENQKGVTPYTFASHVVPSSYCLTYDCGTHKYVFKQTYSSSQQPNEICFNLKPLKCLLDNMHYSVFFFSVKFADCLKDDFSLPNTVSFENTITFDNLDFLDASTRLIVTQQELDFSGMSLTIDRLLGLNVSGENKDHYAIFSDFLGRSLVEEFLKNKFVNTSPVTRKEEYKKLYQSMTIQFVN